MRIMINIERQDYKGKPLVNSVTGEEEKAAQWLLDYADELLTNGAHRDSADSISTAPTREEQCCGYPMHTKECPVVNPQRCRCCNTPMGGSDHCPECGCEEYEEMCYPRVMGKVAVRPEGMEGCCSPGLCNGKCLYADRN